MSSKPERLVPTGGSGQRTRWIVAGVALVIVAAFVFTWQFVDPPPPRMITIATGPKGGRYHAFGLELKSYLEQSGLAVELRPTGGSVENLALLRDPGSGVSLALAQSGLGGPDAGGEEDLAALGSLFYEPVWVFVSRNIPLSAQLRDQAGKRIAVGAEGSGVLPVATAMIEAAGITGAELVKAGGEEARDGLRSGKLDAAFFVMSADAPLARELLNDEGLRPVPFPNARAFAVRHRFLTPVEIGQGLVDIAKNLPPEPLPLAACAATLVARRDIHPAVVPLVLDAARKALLKGGILEEPGQFPSPRWTSFPLAPEAARYYHSGPPFLQRYLPFRIASLLDRLKIMLVPVLTLLLPVIRLAGPTWRWRARRRIIRWYRVLRDIDRALVAGEIEDPAAELEKIAKVRRETLKLRVPLSFADNLYQLQFHLDQVAERLRECGKSKGVSSAAS